MRRFRIFDYSLREEASAVVFLPLVKAILCSLSILKGANGRTVGGDGTPFMRAVYITAQHPYMC
ncbi:hypothetical protein C5167_047958 [Papaver somniferum]|uniref:Uncharacterized protein n=1 Tax=Papaver somniferum TaxID=3469 RepID=A0A4Y7KJF3_PAPSO|nr:hypothetical protein C5167_047958 [Papaver somniferum]